MPTLPGTGPYLQKDQAKSDRATCFIGRGSDRSSTNRYRLAWGELANKGAYTPDDIVFVSAEGNRTGRVPAFLGEVRRACEGGAKIITDVPWDRERPYNVGEREVAKHLAYCGYTEIYPGCWLGSPKPTGL